MGLIVCKSIFGKIRGLMFRWPKEGIVFVNKKPAKFDLHTFFVFYPIDILFLDKNKKIIKVYKRVRPFKFYIEGIESKYIVELRNSREYKIGEKFNF